MGRITRKTIIDFFAEMDEVISKLSLEEAGMVYAACVKYCATGEIPEISEKAEMVFLMLKREFDAEKSHIEEVSKNRSHKKTSVPNEPNVPNGTNGPEEKESIPSPLSPSLSSPEPPSNTPPIIPQPLKEKESRTKKKSEPKPRHKHGEYGHVLLTDEEFDHLAADFGQGERDFQIQMMDEYAELNRKNYDNWNLAIRKAKREGWFDRQRGAVKPFTGNKQTQERKEAKLREYDEMTRKTFEALGFDYGSNT